MLKEFKEFALKGNIMDMAVGVIIGGAFQSVVKSLVNDIIMPAISIVAGKVDFNDLVFTVGNASIKYGSFITAIVDFLIIAFSIFLVIKYINRLNRRMEELRQAEIDKITGKLPKEIKWLKKKKKKTDEKKDQEESTTKICPYCLSEINAKASRCPHCTSDLNK